MEEDGTATALKRVEKITGKPVTFYKCDLLDEERLMKIFSQVNYMPYMPLSVSFDSVP